MNLQNNLKLNTNINSIKLNLSDYSKPYYFMLQSNYLIRIMDILWPILLFSAIYISIFIVEQDIQQGENYKIIYIHVPSAWISLLNYILLSVASIFYLMSSHPIAHIVSYSIAKLGLVFTFICLVTGSFWGLPVWGTYWVWDGRLTSMLLLFFLYLTYLLFSNSFANEKDGAKVSSILAIVGLINIPIIKYSVEWWTTLHQSASFSQMNSSIDPSMALPLMLIFISLFIFCLSKSLSLIRTNIIKRKIESFSLSNIYD